MIDLTALARLAETYAEELQHKVAPLVIGGTSYDTDERPVLMGTVNLSRDSTYRESVAVSTEAAVRKAKVQAAQGAAVVDLGAESSTAGTELVDAADQIDRLVPAVRELAEAGVPTSVESYHPEVVAAVLEAGASMINLTGAEHDAAVFDLIGRAGATLLLCYSSTANVRQAQRAADEDPFPALLDHFEERLAAARAAGVQRIVVDPGIGFYYRNLVEPSRRIRYQSTVLLQTFRLRSLGLPICHALPHAFELFEDEFRTAEGFFAVWARLGGAGLFRTHEVARLRGVLDGMDVVGEAAAAPWME